MANTPLASKTEVCAVCECSDNDHYDWCTPQARQAAEQRPSKELVTELWVVLDPSDNDSVYSAPYEEACHEHINEAIGEDIDGAGSWVVRRFVLAHEPPPAPVAYRKFVDSVYDHHPRYTFREDTGIGAPEGWQPLYAAPPRAPSPPAVSPIGTKTYTAAIRPDGELARYREQDGDPIVIANPGPYFAFNHSGARIVQVMIVEVPATSETKPAVLTRICNVCETVHSGPPCPSGETSVPPATTWKPDPNGECEHCGLSYLLHIVEDEYGRKDVCMKGYTAPSEEVGNGL